MSIKLYSNFKGDPRTLASKENRLLASSQKEEVHGLTPDAMGALNKRMDQMLPKLATIDPSASRKAAIQDGLPQGATFDVRTANCGTSPSLGGGNRGTSLNTIQRPYQPEFESPDRQQYPVHRILANRYWRLFHKLDPVIGNGIDLFSEMPWSDFDLTGPGVDGEIKEQYQRMCDTCQLLAVLPYFVREFLVVGEVVPHCFFDNEEDIWTYIALHNPDQLEVIDAPFIRMDPIVEFVPDDSLRQIVTSNDPLLKPVRDSMPPELISRLQARQSIPLATDLNVTFIARKLHPYDTRGTSIISRMWRILMYEDAIFNASIATARRHAGPLKVAKLGNPQSGWIPGPEHERRFLELVSQAELDPHAWIVYHFGLALESFGTTDRVMTINREWEIIERIKLVALGLSKSFLHGEVSYASASTGLQVFLRRLLAIRKFFESVWIYPRFFKPIAEINEWYRRDKSEINHRYRVKRTAEEIRRENRLIVPTIVWNNSLNPNVDDALVRAYESLERIGVKISKGAKLASVNLDFEKELDSSIREEQLEKEKRQELGVDGGEEEVKNNFSPYGEEHKNPDKPETSLRPVYPLDSEEIKPEPTTVDSEVLNSAIWLDGRYGNWHYQEVEDLVELIKYGNTDDAFWQKMLPYRKTEHEFDPEKGERYPVTKWIGEDPHDLFERGEFDDLWDLISGFLADEGYPRTDVIELREILFKEGVLPESERKPTKVLDEFYDNLPDETSEMPDSDFGSLFETAVKRSGIRKKGSNGTKGYELPFSGSRKSKSDNFLVGSSSWSVVQKRNKNLSGDISHLLKKGNETPALCDCGHPHHKHEKVAIETPEIKDPTNYESRKDWQEALHRSKIPSDSKRYIKQLENDVIDGADVGFEGLWSEVEKRLDRGLPLDSTTLSEIISDASRKVVRNIDVGRVSDAFTGLYSSGKELSYEPMGYKKKKLERVKRFKGAQRNLIEKTAVTIDSLEDQRALERMRETALEKVKSITDTDLRDAILEKLTDPSAIGKNPMTLANEVIKEERAKREQNIDSGDTEGRQELQNQLKDLYDKQLWKIQRVMRTESVNGMVQAQLRGYQEQGVQKIQWNSHRGDPKTCPLCRSLDGQEFEISAMLSGDRQYVLTQYSHPNCRCFISPVLGHLTSQQFETQLRDNPSSFQKGNPGVNPDLIADIFKEVQTSAFQATNAPVEYEDDIKAAGDAIGQSTYKTHQPSEVEFVDDVYRLDEFRREVNPEQNLSGQVVSWTSPTTGKTYVSRFAAEGTPIEDVLIRNWAQEVWSKEEAVRSDMEKLYDRTSERTEVPSIDPGSVQIIKTTYEPQVVGRPYYYGDQEVLSLDGRFRRLTKSQAKKKLLDAGMPESDAETVSTFMKEDPAWDLSSGESVVTSSPNEQNMFVNQQASMSPDQFFQESMVAFVFEPHTLMTKDPDLYDHLKARIFNGKEFKT